MRINTIDFEIKVFVTLFLLTLTPGYEYLNRPS